MVQKRYINYGTPADAAKVKAISKEFFAPQVLSAQSPFFSVITPDQLLIQPHSLIFFSGIVLVEDETQAITIDTSYSSSDYTIYYEHTDEDQIGGAAAELKTITGLHSSVDGVILGWIVYPGGAVVLDATMLYTNVQARITADNSFKSYVQTPDRAVTIVASSTVTTSQGGIRALAQTIPTAPYQIILPDLTLSRKIALTSKQHIRVYSHDDEAELTRVTSNPSAGEYSVAVASGTFRFHEDDVGKIIDISDMTYGGTLDHSTNSSLTASAVEDLLFVFPATDVPIKTIRVDYVIFDGYTLDLVEIIDVAGVASVVSTTKDEPSGSADGSISRLIIRLTEGAYYGTEGEQFIVRLRKNLDPSGEGLLLRVSASTNDSPF